MAYELYENFHRTKISCYMVTVLMPKPHNIAVSSFNQILFVLPSSLPLPLAYDIAGSKGTRESMCCRGEDWSAGTTSEN